MWRLDKATHEQLLSCRRLWVGVSGGLDSIVLLHALTRDKQLLDKLHAIHIHHGLSPNADAWQAHVEAFCMQHDVPLTVKAIHIDKRANLEEAARDKRRECFRALMQSSDALLFAHHKDDQAETLLLNLFRGAGIEGLAAMPLMQPFGEGVLVRPLLHQTRADLYAYAKQHQLEWIEDESNQNIDFSRNYLRHEILPRLKMRWPSVVEAISGCAKHAQTATKSLQALAELDAEAQNLHAQALSLKPLYDLPHERLVQVLRVWLKQNGIKSPGMRQFNMLLTSLVFSRRDSMPSMQFGSAQVRRYRDVLYCVHLDDTVKPTLPHTETNARVSYRFRQGGETMRWRGHTRQLKYIFQTLGVPPWLRDTIPLVFIDNTLVGILDFAIADGYTKEDVYDPV